MAKGISLHIGVNEYDMAQYKKMGLGVNPLPNCARDAKAKMEMAKQFRFSSFRLTDKQATSEHIAQGIRWAARSLEDGDIFFISFSGHGLQVPDRNFDEKDGWDEAWCLYDRPVIDDELFRYWQLFRPGVRILVIADCCHSGTSVKNVKYKPRRKNTGPVKGDSLQASLLLLAACQDEQEAYAGQGISYSLYTYWLLKVLAQQYQFCSSYRDLHNRVWAHMPNDAKPNLFLYGPGAERFVKQRPFRI